eukprot:5251798-Amphidinium_carterae.1
MTWCYDDKHAVDLSRSLNCSPIFIVLGVLIGQGLKGITMLDVLCRVALSFVFDIDKDFFMLLPTRVQNMVEKTDRRADPSKVGHIVWSTGALLQ